MSHLLHHQEFNQYVDVYKNSTSGALRLPTAMRIRLMRTSHGGLLTPIERRLSILIAIGYKSPWRGRPSVT